MLLASNIKPEGRWQKQWTKLGLAVVIISYAPSLKSKPTVYNPAEATGLEKCSLPLQVLTLQKLLSGLALSEEKASIDYNSQLHPPESAEDIDPIVDIKTKYSDKLYKLTNRLYDERNNW